MIFLGGLVFLSSFLLVYLVRIFCFKFNILDIPNNRSSHKKPTALMGGIGFILAFLIGYALGLKFGYINFNLQNIVIIFCALLLAGISLIDDVKKISTFFRFLIHLILASITFLVEIKISVISFPFFQLNIPIVLDYLLTVIFIVAMINIYNFMDGIDGYAGGMGFFGALSFAFFSWQFLQNREVSVILIFLALALLGFLIWNYPRAKIFMGDVGSAFLGYIFAVYALLVSQASGNKISLVVPIMILGVFVIDASLTLVQRALKGEKFWEAHRGHYYQRLNILGWSHKRIIWLEYTHIMINLGLSFLYLISSAIIQTLIIFIFLMLFALKFGFIIKLEKNKRN